MSAAVTTVVGVPRLVVADRDRVAVGGLAADEETCA
jgi:hypothetical protein